LTRRAEKEYENRLRTDHHDLKEKKKLNKKKKNNHELDSVLPQA
jgi:hypothetical protein